VRRAPKKPERRERRRHDRRQSDDAGESGCAEADGCEVRRREDCIRTGGEREEGVLVRLRPSEGADKHRREPGVEEGP
jgi:hypothetical protein